MSTSLSALLLATVSVGVQGAITFQSTGNPILADGSYYSADPAPLVVNDTLYIIAGRDQAPADENDFVINEWEIFSTTSATPAGGEWTLYPAIAFPHNIFKWAAVGTAYAAQIVEGGDGKFYLYAPVTEANSNNADKFAIGVSAHISSDRKRSTNLSCFFFLCRLQLEAAHWGLLPICILRDLSSRSQFLRLGMISKTSTLPYLLMTMAKCTSTMVPSVNFVVTNCLATWPLPLVLSLPWTA